MDDICSKNKKKLEIVFISKIKFKYKFCESINVFISYSVIFVIVQNKYGNVLCPSNYH